MTTNTTSTNPIVQAILGGTAPPQARLAAARGMLPLAQEDLLEILVALRAGDEREVAEAAEATLAEQDPGTLLGAASAKETAPAVLGYLAGRANLGRAVQEAVALNASTPDAAVATLAATTADGVVLEIISTNQQRLIRAPAIIEAVLANTARTPEAERRVRETQREFFEKERGAQQVAEEMRARGMSAAAEFFESAESLPEGGGLALNDAWLIAQHIEVSDAEIDDSWLDKFDEFYEETEEQRIANAERVIAESRTEGRDLEPERVSLIRRIMLMKVKDRIKLGMKGDREARSTLVRDPNKIVSTAVIHNPRITDQEIEAISAMRAVSDEVLRQIAMNRAWARSYPIIHNLARNPRTPVGTAMGLLTRLYTRDLKALAQNRNVSESVRRQANRLTEARGGH